MRLQLLHHRKNAIEDAVHFLSSLFNITERKLHVD